MALSHRQGTSRCLSCQNGEVMVWHTPPRGITPVNKSVYHPPFVAFDLCKLNLSACVSKQMGISNGWTFSMTSGTLTVSGITVRQLLQNASANGASATVTTSSRARLRRSMISQNPWWCWCPT